MSELLDFPINGFEIDLDEGVRIGDVGVQPYRFRDPYWKFSFTPIAMTMEDIRAVEAYKYRHSSGINPASVYDPRRPVPKYYLKHYRKNKGYLGARPWSNATLVSSDRAASTLTISGADDGFRVSVGDWIGYTDAAGRVRAAQAQNDVTAVSGLNMVIKVRPRPPQASSSGALSFEKVPVPMKLEFSPIVSSSNTAFFETYSVSGIEDIPAF